MMCIWVIDNMTEALCLDYLYQCPLETSIQFSLLETILKIFYYPMIQLSKKKTLFPMYLG